MKRQELGQLIEKRFVEALKESNVIIRRRKLSVIEVANEIYHSDTDDQDAEERIKALFLSEFWTREAVMSRAERKQKKEGRKMETTKEEMIDRICDDADREQDLIQAACDKAQEELSKKYHTDLHRILNKCKRQLATVRDELKQQIAEIKEGR